MPAMLDRWCWWYRAARANGHTRLWAAKWAAGVAWALRR